MAAIAVIPSNYHKPLSTKPIPTKNFNPTKSYIPIKKPTKQINLLVLNKANPNSHQNNNSNHNPQTPPIPSDSTTEVDNLGVKAALSMLKFYKREISPLLPNSCRYVPTCSEYSMQAYKKYGVVKGTVLTAWRLCRCNPLGGSGFDPPRWFDEESPAEEGDETF